MIALTNQALDHHDWTGRCRLLCTLLKLAPRPGNLVFARCYPLSMTRAYLNALNTLDNKRKFGQASDPCNIVPCLNNFSLFSVPGKRHMTYSTHPGLDIRQWPCLLKRVSFSYRCSRDELRTCATPLLSPPTFPFTAGPSQSPLVR